MRTGAKNLLRAGVKLLGAGAAAIAVVLITRAPGLSAWPRPIRLAIDLFSLVFVFVGPAIAAALFFAAFQTAMAALEQLKHNEVKDFEHLLSCMNDRRPFALYLRNHAPDLALRLMRRGPQDLLVENGGRPVLPFAPLPPSSPYEDSVVELLRGLVVFALVHDDSINPGKARKIDASKSNWKERVERAMEAATLVVVVVGELSDGICFELERLNTESRALKCWLIVDVSVADELERRFPVLAAHALARQQVTLSVSLVSGISKLPEAVQRLIANFAKSGATANQPR